MDSLHSLEDMGQVVPNAGFPPLPRARMELFMPSDILMLETSPSRGRGRSEPRCVRPRPQSLFPRRVIGCDGAPVCLRALGLFRFAAPPALTSSCETECAAGERVTAAARRPRRYGTDTPATPCGRRVPTYLGRSALLENGSIAPAPLIPPALTPRAYPMYHDFMYLSGSKWSMNRKRKPGSPWRIILLLALIAAAVYVNQVIVPVTPPLFLPTPTLTRSPDSFLVEAQQNVLEGKVDLAIAAYEQAISADPKNINLYLDLARLEILYEKYDQAEENYQNAILLNPRNSLALAVKGWALGRQGDYTAGTAQLNSAIEIDQGNALAWAYLAEILAMQLNAGKGDLTTQDRAIAASRTAMELAPNLLEVHRARGLVLEMTGNNEEAIAEYVQALAQNDKIADLHLSLGRNYKAVDDYVSAFEEFNRAIGLNPTDPQPYIETALVYLNRGEHAKAAQMAESAVQQDPSDPMLYGYLGTIYFRAQNWNSAVKALRYTIRGGAAETSQGELVEVKPIGMNEDTLALFARFGIALARTGQCGEGLEISQQLLQAFPDDETNVYNANEIVAICSGTTQATPTPPPGSPSAAE